MLIKEKKIEQLLEIIENYTYTAYLKALRDLPNQKPYFDKMTNPEIGNIVLEISAIGKTKKIIDRIGHLISVKDIPYPDWDGKEPAQKREIWKIKTFDEREEIWVNPSFIAIPKNYSDVKL